MIKLISIDDIPQTSRYRGKDVRIRDIEKFLASKSDAAEIILEEGESPSGVLASVKNAISKYKHYRDLCYATQRAGRVFLVRWPDKRMKDG